jgi:hypothetical protein
LVVLAAFVCARRRLSNVYKSNLKFEREASASAALYAAEAVPQSGMLAAISSAMQARAAFDRHPEVAAQRPSKDDSRGRLPTDLGFTRDQILWVASRL